MKSLLLIVLCLLIAAPVLAQEVTPVPLPDAPVVVVEAPERAPELVYILFTVVVLAVLATLVLLGRPLIKANAENVPPWLLDSAMSAVDTLLQRVEEYVFETPPTYDDAAVEALRREFEELKASLRPGPRGEL